MKLKYFYTLFVLGLVALIGMGSSGGRAASQGWGNTGAPGDQLASGQPRTCITCHGNTAGMEVDINLEITDAAGAVVSNDQYIGGEKYSLKVSLSDVAGSPSAYGFQLLCLNADVDVNGTESSTYSNPSSNAQIAMAANTNRTYVEQTGPSANSDFTVDWTAPDAGAGTITFYLCGNGVDQNSMTSGDGADCTKVTLTEDVPSKVNDLAAVAKVLLSPNPSNGDFALMIQGNEYRDGKLNIRDMTGKTIHSENLAIQSGENTKQIAFNAPAKGLYLVQIETQDGVRTEKLMVQ